MTIQAGTLSELQIGVETPWPLKRQGKQVYAKLIDFGGFPAPYGLKGKTHDVPDIEWSQISWDHSFVASSDDASRRRSLALVSTPASSGGSMPWRFLVDKNSVQVNMLTNTDYREWDNIVLCLLYTKAGDGAASGRLIQPGPEGAVLTSRENELVWEAGGGSFERYDLCEFYYFRNPKLRPGFQPAMGALLENAASLYPRAWEFLQTDEGQAMCTSEAEWQAMTRATWATSADGRQVGWDGIGGAPFFAMHMDTGALRLPDLRGMYAEGSGFDSLAVGGVHGDATRPIKGIISRGNNVPAPMNGNGVFFPMIENTGTAASRATNAYGPNFDRLVFDTASVVPTANKNQPRAWGALACVYLGAPS